MKLSDITKAIEILKKHWPDVEIDGNVHQDHDEVQIYPNVEFFRPEMVTEMSQNGWMVTEDGDGFFQFT